MISSLRVINCSIASFLKFNKSANIFEHLFLFTPIIEVKKNNFLPLNHILGSDDFIRMKFNDGLRIDKTNSFYCLNIEPKKPDYLRLISIRLLARQER